MGMMGQPVPKGAKKVNQLSQEELAMREYALGESGASRTDGMVLLHVSHSNLKQTFFHELRLDMHQTIAAVKRKLEFHTGTGAVNCQVCPGPCFSSWRASACVSDAYVALATATWMGVRLTAGCPHCRPSFLAVTLALRCPTSRLA